MTENSVLVCILLQRWAWGRRPSKGCRALPPQKPHTLGVRWGNAPPPSLGKYYLIGWAAMLKECKVVENLNILFKIGKTLSFLQKPLKGLWNVKMTGSVNSILDRCKTAIFPALEEGGILQSDWITHQGRIFHSGIVHFLFLHFPDIKLNVMCRNFQAEYKLSRSQLN